MLAALKRLFASSPASERDAPAPEAQLELDSLSVPERQRLISEIATLVTRVANARSTLSTSAIAALEKQLGANPPLSDWLSGHTERLRAAREIFDLGTMEVALDAINDQLQALTHHLEIQGESNG